MGFPPLVRTAREIAGTAARRGCNREKPAELSEASASTTSSREQVVEETFSQTAIGAYPKSRAFPSQPAACGTVCRVEEVHPRGKRPGARQRCSATYFAFSCSGRSGVLTLAETSLCSVSPVSSGDLENKARTVVRFTRDLPSPATSGHGQLFVRRPTFGALRVGKYAKRRARTVGTGLA